MLESHFQVGIVVAKRKLKGPWADFAWLPHAVLPDAPAAPPWTRLAIEGDDEIFYAGPFDLCLHPGATAHYRDNLLSGRPALWVALRPVGGDEVEVATVTADPYEGEALAGGIGEIVDQVPMPPEVQARVAGFFDAFHVERTFVKRQRDRADPDALGRPRPDFPKPEETE